MSPLPMLDLPSDTARIVIFDTNAYRELTFGESLAASQARAIETRQLGAQQRILALASPIVIWELAAHLADPADPAYQHCLNALVALGEHTRSSHAQVPGIYMALDSEWVCDALFEMTPPGADKNVALLGGLATHIRDHAPTLTDSAVLANLTAFSDAMAMREATWLGNIQKLLDWLHPSDATTPAEQHKEKIERKQRREALASKEFEDLWAMVAVAHYASLVNVTLGAQELVGRADFFREQFSVPFHLIMTLLRNLLGQDLNLFSAKRKRGNYLWDAGLCYLIPSTQTPGKPEIDIVSGDQAIVSAANASGFGDRVISLPEFRKRIGLP
jgi:hypothetical protein